MDTITLTGETTLDLEDLFDDIDSYDPVNKPAHYNLSGGIECIDYIKQVLKKITGNGRWALTKPTS